MSNDNYIYICKYTYTEICRYILYRRHSEMILYHVNFLLKINFEKEQHLVVENAF